MLYYAADGTTENKKGERAIPPNPEGIGFPRAISMKIQSLSVVVPNKGCINNCPFCVSRMLNNSSDYPNLMDIDHPEYDYNVREYLKRLRYVAENGCQTLMLTGTSEPQQNKQFLATFALLHKQIGSPFTNIEMQTTGMGLDNDRNYLRFLRNFVGVNTVALSVNSMDDMENCRILGHKPLVEQAASHQSITEIRPRLKLPSLCDLLKEYGFNIRVCINLSDAFNKQTFDSISIFASSVLHADQLTFRRLYYAVGDDTSQAKWIAEHQPSGELLNSIELNLGTSPIIGETAYGAICYDVKGMSVIYDCDCMGKNPESEVKKYLILRPNCKLYSQWDSKASLVF